MTLESPLDSKEIKLVNTKGNQPWIFTGGTDAEAEATILRPPDRKSRLIVKDPMLGKIEGRRRRGWQRMRWLDGWHHWLNGHEFEQTPETVKDREAWCAACSPWGWQRVGHDLVIKQQEMTMIRIKGSLDESYRNMSLSSKQGKIYHSWNCPRLVEVKGVCWQRPSRGMMTVRGSYTGREVEWDKLYSHLCWTWVFTLLSADGTNLA